MCRLPLFVCFTCLSERVLYEYSFLFLCRFFRLKTSGIRYDGDRDKIVC